MDSFKFMKKSKYDRSFRTILIVPIHKKKKGYWKKDIDVTEKLNQEWAKSGSELSFLEWILK